MKRAGIPMAEIDTTIEKALRDWRVPGAAVAIFQRDDILLAKGYGVKEIGKDDPVDAHTIFPICSCTKAFTAAAIGALVDEGKVDWDDKIVQYLPDFQLYDPWITQDVTIRDMLTHRAGIERTQRLMRKDPTFDPDEVIWRMRYMKPAAPFRTKSHYNNPGYIVAGKIVEVVSGQSWEDFLERRFFQPLGMTSTSPTYSEHLQKGLTNVAAPHAAVEFGLVPSGVRMFDPVEPVPWVDIGKNAAGSIMSTVSDCIPWLKMLINDGLHDGQQLLSPAVVKELTRAQIVINQEADQEIGSILGPMGVDVNILAYALGWWVGEHRGRYLVFHGGQWLGFNTALMFMPQERVGVAMFLNTTQTVVHAALGFYIVDALFGTPLDYSGRAAAMMKAVEAQVRDRVHRMIAARDKDLAPSLPLEDYVGTYASDLFGEIKITLRDGQLYHEYATAGALDAPLEHWEGDTFLARYRSKLYDPEFITFTVEADDVRALYMKDPAYPSDTFYRVV